MPVFGMAPDGCRQRGRCPGLFTFAAANQKWLQFDARFLRHPATPIAILAALVGIILPVRTPFSTRPPAKGAIRLHPLFSSFFPGGNNTVSGIRGVHTIG